MAERCVSRLKITGKTILPHNLRALHNANSNIHLLCRPRPGCRCPAPAPDLARRSHPRTSSLRLQANASSARTSKRYTGPGPYATAELGTIPLVIPVGQGSGGIMNIELEIYRPVGAVSNCPLAVFSAGFLLNGSLYRSYATALASWGYVAVLYDLSELSDDMTTVNHIRSILDICQTTPSIAKLININCVYLIGHSRGGKLSVLAAARDARVAGLCLLDPVDNTPMTPEGPGYPSALPNLTAISSRRGRPVPVAIIGAALNTDVVPAQSNYSVLQDNRQTQRHEGILPTFMGCGRVFKWAMCALGYSEGRGAGKCRRFTSAAGGPCWEVELKGAGHLQFTDRQVPLLQAFSTSGPTPDELVRKVSKAVMIAWGERLVRPLAEGRPLPPREELLDAFASDSAELSRIAQLESHINGLGALPTTSYTGPSSSSSERSEGRASTSASSAGARQQPAGSSRLPPVTESYDQLMQRRAKELKEMLVQRGINCADCFEKQDLARRIIERCSVR